MSATQAASISRAAQEIDMCILFESFFLRFGCTSVPCAKGTFSQNPKECLVAEEALVGHAEATKIAEADLVVTHTTDAYPQLHSNSTQ